MHRTVIKSRPFGAEGEEQPTNTKDRQIRTATESDKATAETI